MASPFAQRHAGYSTDFARRKLCGQALSSFEKLTEIDERRKRLQELFAKVFSARPFFAEKSDLDEEQSVV